MPRKPTEKAYRKDLYAVLQVHRRADPNVIKAAYRELMKANHPDHAGSEDAAKAINEAYQVLSDSGKRKKYDAHRNRGEGTVIGNFRIIEQIAEGGFGTTYKAEHVKNGKLACIKHCSEISPEAEAILVEETDAIWDLRHHGIPVMRDLLTLDDGSLALAMSYVPGYTLEQAVEKIERIPPEHVAWMTERILNTLWYLHSHGVVHGDIKPQNIIIDPENHHVTLIDFGLAQVKPDSGTRGKGYTELFSPPEQIRGLPLIPETDFYSLGVTLLYALSGDYARAARREIAAGVPAEFKRFIADCVRIETLSRPNWSKGNPFEDFKEMRIRAFGREHSNREPIKGL